MTKAAILAGFDSIEWVSTTLFTRNGTPVAAPALATMNDKGHYPDVVSFLNGWATDKYLSSRLDAQWGANPGTLTAGIDSSNRFYVEFTGAVISAFTVTRGSSDPWGWGAATVAGVNTSGTTWRATATSAFTRGNFTGGSNEQFFVTADLDTILAPEYQVKIQSLPTWCSVPGSVDADVVIECLENWDNDAIDNTNRRFSWGIDSEGRTFTSWDANLGSGYSVTWSSASFRRALGFTGTESLVTSNGICTLTSTYPARGVLVLRNGLAVHDPSVLHMGSAVNQLNGRIAGRPVSIFNEIDVSTTLRGGVGLAEARAEYEDEAEIYRVRVAPYLFRGARCTLLPDIADPRMGSSSIQQYVDGDTPQRYSAYKIGIAAGVMGRKRCEVSVDSPTSHLMTFVANTPRIRTGPINWKLRLLD